MESVHQACQPFMIFQECAYKFHRKCFGDLTSLKRKRIQESLTTMQTLEDKHKRMYPMAKGGSAFKREGKRKQKQIKKAPDGARKKMPKSVFCKSCKLMFLWR